MIGNSKYLQSTYKKKKIYKITPFIQHYSQLICFHVYSVYFCFSLFFSKPTLNAHSVDGAKKKKKHCSKLNNNQCPAGGVGGLGGRGVAPLEKKGLAATVNTGVTARRLLLEADTCC